MISKEGILLAVFGAVGIWAYTKHNIILVLLTSYMFLGLLVIALLWAIIASYGIKGERKMPAKALWGEKVPIEIKLFTNNRLSFFHLRVWDRATMAVIHDYPASKYLSSEYFTGEEFISWLRLSRRHPVAETKRTIFNERGRYIIGPMIIEGRDPLGLFRIRRQLPIYNEILVMPGWFRIQKFALKGQSRMPREMATTVPREGASPEFLGVREYSDGDSLRRVHWGLTAKHSRLIVRQFQREVESDLAVILDLQRGHNAGFGRASSLGCMLEVALSLVKYNIDMGFPYAAVFTSQDTIIFESELKHDIFPAILEAAATVLDDNRDPLEDELPGYLRRFHGKSIVLISSRRDEGILRYVQGIALQGIDVIYICVDTESFEEKVPNKERIAEINRMKSLVPEGWRFYYIRKGEDLEALFQ